MIAAFERWGQPQAIRVDNGLPLGDPGSDIAPVMALWLIGLGVDVLWNRPARPTENAKVERMQGVTANWAEPGRCADLAALSSRLEAALEIQRQHYRCRHLGGQTRAERYPELFQKKCPYQAEAFDLDRVLRFLATGQWVRTISKTGQLEFFNQRWALGRSYARHEVIIRFDLADRMWVVCEESGREIKRLDSAFLSSENIWALSLSQRAIDRSLRRKRS